MNIMFLVSVRLNSVLVLMLMGSFIYSRKLLVGWVVWVLGGKCCVIRLCMWLICLLYSCCSFCRWCL